MKDKIKFFSGLTEQTGLDSNRIDATLTSRTIDGTVKHGDRRSSSGDVHPRGISPGGGVGSGATTAALGEGGGGGGVSGGGSLHFEFLSGGFLFVSISMLDTRIGRLVCGCGGGDTYVSILPDG